MPSFPRSTLNCSHILELSLAWRSKGTLYTLMWFLYQLTCHSWNKTGTLTTSQPAPINPSSLPSFIHLSVQPPANPNIHLPSHLLVSLPISIILSTGPANHLPTHLSSSLSILPSTCPSNPTKEQINIY